jgi:hypothetical protein
MKGFPFPRAFYECFQNGIDSSFYEDALTVFRSHLLSCALVEELKIFWIDSCGSRNENDCYHGS